MQERERRHFNELLRQELKHLKAEYERTSRGLPKEVKLQHKAEQEAEFAKKAGQLVYYQHTAVAVSTFVRNTHRH